MGAFLCVLYICQEICCLNWTKCKFFDTITMVLCRGFPTDFASALKSLLISFPHFSCCMVSSSSGFILQRNFTQKGKICFSISPPPLPPLDTFIYFGSGYLPKPGDPSRILVPAPFASSLL